MRAGPTGVWLNAVAVSDENPLYHDANANGIDDAYEISKKGALVPVNASAADRKALATEWQASQRARPVPPVVAVRPLPDRLAAKAANAMQP